MHATRRFGAAHRRAGGPIMKNLIAAFTLVLGGCTSVLGIQEPEVSESTCTAACAAHFDQCPQIFAGFPERGAVECPAEHNNCLQSCAAHHPATRTAIAATVIPPPGTVRAVSSKDARLRELKHLYDEGLVTDDVY